MNEITSTVIDEAISRHNQNPLIVSVLTSVKAAIRRAEREAVPGVGD